MKELQDEIMQAQIDAEKKMVDKENEIRAWERKWQERQPLLSSEEQQYMKEAQQKQNELMIFQQTLEQDLIQKQTELTIAGINRISMFAKQLAMKNGYDFILQYTIGQNIIYVNPKMDVTNELLDIMNKDYYGGDGTPPSEGGEEEDAE